MRRRMLKIRSEYSAVEKKADQQKKNKKESENLFSWREVFAVPYSPFLSLE